MTGPHTPHNSNSANIPKSEPRATGSSSSIGNSAPTSTTPSRDWRTSHLWQIQPVRDILVLATVFGLLWLGYRLSLVTVPLLLALTLAYLVEPLIVRITGEHSCKSKFKSNSKFKSSTSSSRWRLSRSAAAMLLIVASGVLVIAPVVLGGTFAIVQGARFAQDVASDVNLLQQSIDKPTDDGLRFRLLERGKSWLEVRDYVVEQQRRVQAQSNQAQSNQVQSQEDSVTQSAPTSEPSAESPAQSPAESPAAASQTTPPESVSPETARNDLTLDLSMAPYPRPGYQPETISERFVGAVERIAPEDTYIAIQWAIGVLRSNAEAIGKQALQVSGGAVGAAMQTFGAIGKVLFAAFLTAFFFYFVCVGWPKVLVFGMALVPEHNKDRVTSLVIQMDRVIAAFIRGRLTICAILILYYIFGYWVIGVPAPFIIGAVVGLLTLIPYAAGLGLFVSIGLLALSSNEGIRGEWWWILVAPIIVHSLQQLIDDYFLTPRIQGKSTNMDTPTILFASIAGGVLAGFYGLLLAIPVAACIKIAIKEIVWPRFMLWRKGDAADPLPLPGNETTVPRI